VTLAANRDVWSWAGRLQMLLTGMVMERSGFHAELN